MIAELEEQSASLRRPAGAVCSPRAPRRSRAPGSLARDPEAAFEALVAKVRADPVPVPGHVADRRAGRASVRDGLGPCTSPSTGTILDAGAAAADRRQRHRLPGAVRLLHRAQPRRHVQQSLRGQRGGRLPGHPGPDHRPSWRRPCPRPRRLLRCSGAQPLQRDRLLGLAGSCHRQRRTDPGHRVPADRGGRQHRGSRHSLLWAEALATQLSPGVLLTRVGDGHTAYVYSSCIRSDVDALSHRPDRAGRRAPGAAVTERAVRSPGRSDFSK